MKKVFCLLLTVCLLIVFSGCHGRKVIQNDPHVISAYLGVQDDE